MKYRSLAGKTSILIAFVLFSFPAGSQANGVAGDVWFTETMTIDAESVEGGVTVKKDYEGDDGLINEGDEPFYLVRKAPRENPYLKDSPRQDKFPEAPWIPEGLPDEYVPLARLVSGEARYWDWNTPWADGSPPVSPWEPDAPRLQQLLAQGYSREVADLRDFGLVKGLTQHPRRRPLFQMPPPPQPFTFDAYYRGKILKGRGVITYGIPMRAKAEIGLAVGLPTLALIGLLELRARRKRKAKADARTRTP